MTDPTFAAIRLDWLDCLADATSMDEGISRMRTATLLEMDAALEPDTDLWRSDPRTCRKLRRAMRAEIARRATWPAESEVMA